MRGAAWEVTLAGVIAISLLAVPAWGQIPGQSAEDWYRQSYAPQWSEEPWRDVEMAASFYSDIVAIYAPDGDAKVVGNVHWIGESISMWRTEGWTGSELASLHVDQINPRTATFKATWLDHYEDGRTISSCGWYLATLTSGGWKFTAYAERECP